MITIIFGRAAQFLLALVMMRVATTLLSPEEMGRVSLVLTTIGFFAMFLINPVGMFINRRLHAWQAGGVAQYYFIRYVFYLLLSAFVATFLLRLLYISGSINFGVSFSWLTLLLCGSLVFNTINQTAIPSLNLLGDSRRFMLLTICTVAMSLSCATLLVIVLEPVAQYWVSGVLLGQVILSLVGARVLFTKLKKVRAQVSANIQKRHLLTLFHFAWPVSIAAGLGWIQGQGYRYLIEGSLGFAELGLFVAGYGISAGMIAGFESVLTTYFQPRLYRDVSKSDSVRQAEAWQRYAATVIPSLILTVAFVVMLAPELTRILLGENFQSAVDYVLWGALAETARVLIGVYSLIAHVFMRTRWLILPNLVGAFLAITLTALFIPGFGVIGVGMGLVLSGLAVVIMMHTLLAQRVGGGTPIRPMLMAGISAGVLWGMTLFLRHFLNVDHWWLIAGILVPVGFTYLVLQYIFLSKGMMDRVGE